MNLHKMTYFNNIKSFSILLISILFVLICAPTHGASIHLQDNAKVVSPEMAAKLEKELGNIESKDGLHLEVVILPNFYDRQPDAVVNAFYEQLAKNAPQTPKRALLLIVLNLSDVELRTTNDINAAFDSKSFKDISDNIKLKIQAKNYDEMARVGIAGVYHYYEKKFPSAEKKGSTQGQSYFNIVLFVIVLIGVVFLVRAIPKKPLEK